MADKRYLSNHTLENLQANVQELEKKLNYNGMDPLKYFQVLLHTLQFERAINYLLTSEHWLFAVHLAIVCHHYKLLKPTPLLPLQHLNQFQIGDVAWLQKQLNKLTLPFFMDYPAVALQYILVLLPVGDGYDAKSQFTQSQESRSEQFFLEDAAVLIHKSNRVAELVGTMSRQQPFELTSGILFEYIKKENVKSVVRRAAELAETSNNLSQAVELYTLVGADDEAARILITGLSEYCNKPRGDSARQELQQKSHELLQRVQDSRTKLEPSSRKSLQILLHFVYFFNHFHSSTINYDTAEQFLEPVAAKLFDSTQPEFKHVSNEVKNACKFVAQACYNIYQHQYQENVNGQVYGHLSPDSGPILQSKVQRLRTFLRNNQDSLGSQAELIQKLESLGALPTRPALVGPSHGYVSFQQRI